MQAQLRILFLLLVLGAPLTVCAQTQQPHARFSVEPGNPVTNTGFGLEPEPTEYFEGTKFKFTASVPGAVRYEVTFDDGVEGIPETPDSDGIAIFFHTYDKPGEYTAVMRAFNKADEQIERPLELPIKVKRLPADPQPPPPHARFYVTPSDPNDPSDPKFGDKEVTWADFTFTADVSQAQRYELDFDRDDDDEKLEIRPGSGGIAVKHHRYKKPGKYIAKMKAWRNTDEAVEIDRLVSVHAPPPAVAVQWPPPVRPAAVVPPETAKSDILPWLLSVAAIAVLLLRRWGLTGTHPVTFEPTRDRGLLEVIGAAVSMRVRHPKPQFVISDDAIVLGARVEHGATKVDS